jgi:hypothetical protein
VIPVANMAEAHELHRQRNPPAARPICEECGKADAYTLVCVDGTNMAVCRPCHVWLDHHSVPPHEVFNPETKQFERNTTRVLGHVHGRASHAHAWGDTPHDHLLRAVCGRSECQGMTAHNIHRGPGHTLRLNEDLGGNALPEDTPLD